MDDEGQFLTACREAGIADSDVPALRYVGTAAAFASAEHFRKTCEAMMIDLPHNQRRLAVGYALMAHADMLVAQAADLMMEKPSGT